MRAVAVASMLFLLAPVLVVFLPPADAATVSVTVSNFMFSPSSVTIGEGDTVQWNWAGGTHSVVQDGGTVWCTVRSSGSCTKTFATAGTYSYFCSVHPASMRGTVRLLGAAPTITITAPADGSTVSGTFTVSGAATGAGGVAKVEVRLGAGAWLLATGTTSWSRAIDTSATGNGAATVEARVIAGDGQTAVAAIGVTVANPVLRDLWLQTFLGSTSLTGDPTLRTAIRNLGNVDVTSSVLFEYRYKGEWHPIETQTFTIPAFGTRNDLFVWRDIWLYGRFEVRGTVDPGNEITETQETNNQRTSSAAFYTTLVSGVDLRDP